MLNLWAVMGVRMRSEPVPALLDREAERAALDGLLGDLRSGRGRVLVVRGEAGVGKSALLDYVAGAAGMRERPLLCVVDDAQWLDRASAQVLAFAARRLLAEPVGLIFAVREPGEAFGGLAELEVRGLPEKDARALLGSVVGFHLDERVRDRIVAETAGNPLALLELPRGLGAAQLAGGFWLPGAVPVPARIEGSGGGWRRCPAARGRCCWSRRPSRPGIPCWCGGPLSGWGSRLRRRRRPRRTGCWRPGRRCGSGIRWCGRRCTPQRRCRNGGRRTGCWRR